MNGADRPAKVTSVSEIIDHSVSRLGKPGFPSKSTIDEPVSRPEIRKFHIIHPVVENQKNRSPGPRSICKPSCFTCSSKIPPWPWTIALGSPVVPEEYKM